MESLKKYQPIAFPTLAVVIILVLCVASGNFLFGRINTLRAEANSLRSKNDVLAERFSTLQDVEFEISSAVNVASVALPPDNPSVLVTSTLKEVSAEWNVSVSRFTISSVQIPGLEGVEPISNYEINFEAQAEDYQAINSFVSDLSAVRPLLSLESVTTEQTNLGGVEARIRLNAYSSPFPSELPALDTPLSGLSPAEEETLSLLETYSAAAVSDQTPTVEVTPRENPFSLDI